MIDTLMPLTFTRTNLTTLLLGTFLALGGASPAFSAEYSNSQAATGAPAIQAGQGQDFAADSVDLADDDIGQAEDGG